jgi:hypothetical protein
MPGRAAKVIITERQQEVLQTLTRSSTCPQALAQRAHLILLAFEGWDNEDIADRLGCERNWRNWGRFRELLSSTGFARKVFRSRFSKGISRYEEGPLLAPTSSVQQAKGSASARPFRWVSFRCLSARSEMDSRRGGTRFVSNQSALLRREGAPALRLVKPRVQPSPRVQRHRWAGRQQRATFRGRPLQAIAWWTTTRRRRRGGAGGNGLGSLVYHDGPSASLP